MIIKTDLPSGQVEVSIVLSDGTKAGTGFAGTYENAFYFAAKDAAASSDERSATAGEHYLTSYDHTPRHGVAR
jgi:hypothetical protein